mgnify:FL=1|tara:strand:+ start:686 stop:880 length:195 start_codon:yes stop_codon:yes gene_type:complete
MSLVFIEDAIIGMWDNRDVYLLSLIVDIVMHDKRIGYEEAREYIDLNIADNFKGDECPIIVSDI